MNEGEDAHSLTIMEEEMLWFEFDWNNHFDRIISFKQIEKFYISA